MGRKPVLGLVGACLTSVALAGCADNCCLWDRSPKKDTTISSTAGGGSRTTGTDPGWRDSRVGSTGSSSTFNGGSSAGSSGGTGAYGGSAITAGGGAGGSGSFGAAPSSPYPGGTSMRDPAGNSSFSHTSSPSTTGPDVTGGRSTQPANYNDATSGGASAVSSPSPLPPLTPSGAARPRTDDLAPAKSPKVPAIDPPSQLPSASTNSGLPPVADPPAPKTPSADGLPPIPTPTSQKGLERPLPPIAPPQN